MSKYIYVCILFPQGGSIKQRGKRDLQVGTWIVAPLAYQKGPLIPYSQATLELCKMVAAHVHFKNQINTIKNPKQDLSEDSLVSFYDFHTKKNQYVHITSLFDLQFRVIIFLICLPEIQQHWLLVLS